MAKHKTSDEQRLVWRITPEAPHGEVVEAGIKRPRPPPREPASDEWLERGWVRSSYDLLNGLEVSETGAGELYEDLFETPAPMPAEPGGPPAGRDRWVLRFSLRLADLDVRREPREVIGLARRLWPTQQHLSPETAAEAEHERDRKAGG